MLKKEFIRDGNRRIIGSVTTGFTGAFDTVVRDESGHLLGRTSEHFGTTRDDHGKLGLNRYRRPRPANASANSSLKHLAPSSPPFLSS